MSMESNHNKKENFINPEFEDLFKFNTEEEDDEHEARMIMYRFLSEIERSSGQKRGLKKRLADAIGTSQSFITQLFNGDKFVNMLNLAKFQKALKIKFRIVAYPEKEFEILPPVGENDGITANIFIIQPKFATNDDPKAFVQYVPKSNKILS